MTATATFAPREENVARQPCTGIMNDADESMATQTEPLAIDQQCSQAEAESMEQQNDTMSDITHQHGSTHDPLKECQVETVESVTPEPPSSKHRPSHANVVSSDKEEETVHSPTVLPQFTNSSTAMWTATHAANAPSEDQSSSLTNVLLRPKHEQHHSLIRLSLWSVIDGHGGGIMATYAAQVLLPHITASISRSLDCDIVQQGECRVNDELRDDAIDFHGLLKSSGKSRYNANSIHYSTPREEETNKLVAKETDVNDKNKSIEDGPVGTHSTDEVARVTNAVTDSFCAVDEGWINSIDVMTTRQTSCQKNGAWNAGACALVVFTIQRLEWTRTTTPDEPCTVQEPNNNEETSQKCTIMDCEPELTETQDDNKSIPEIVHTSTGSHQSASQSQLNTTPGGCECHDYSPQPAMLYTAHVGDCRAILLGNALPDGSGCNINGNTVTTDEDSHGNEETELLSSSDSSTSSEDDDDLFARDTTPPHLRYMTRPSRSIMQTTGTRLSRRNRSLIPLNYDCSEESDDEHEPARKVSKKNASPAKLSLSSENNAKRQPSVLQLPASVQCLTLTTDHNPYNEAEASAVLRRCNNAPKAIYSGASGAGLRRVAGSLSVTRALGDAYLKTPLLSFGSYKKKAPYITALPEINSRLLPTVGKENASSSVLVLATDGVWEQNSGEDILDWMRNYSDECTAARAERERNLGDASNGDVGASSPEKKKRKLPRRYGEGPSKSAVASNASEVIVTRVLNNAGRSNKMSIRQVLALPKGRARRYHDDLTVIVVDLSKFVASP